MILKDNVETLKNYENLEVYEENTYLKIKTELTVGGAAYDKIKNIFTGMMN